jgi:hypothetical protein
MKKWYEMTDSEVAKNFDGMARDFFFENQFALLHLLDRWKEQEVAYLDPIESGRDSFVKSLKPSKKNLAVFDAINANDRFYRVQEESLIKEITANPSLAEKLVVEFFEEKEKFMDEFFMIVEKFELKAVA